MKGSLCQPAETSFLWRDTAMRIRERFNPRAPCGARPNLFVKVHSLRHFNPRAPCGARRYSVSTASEPSLFQPTRPLRGATDRRRTVLHLWHRFQPTRPLRGATMVISLSLLSIRFQPTRPLRGATLKEEVKKPKVPISTHAPLAGRDSKSVQITMHIFAITDKFQMLLHRMPPVRAFCSFLMQENHADFGCEPPK